ncbi:MAG: transposase [Flavobacteriales bacterium]|jgi:REP element-mobilizing transposase RayT|nr:transposase [Flavobacteriales bacterium]MBK6891835.1 transposase [Flavobacteriales bacterium]MBK7248523.1 transposase [Flavobacteriales bacterium]MBK9059256.1 transposase [Flavobacteriales bacterium]MBK9597810.1 transposase [Flavobacteriales bacterium]
MAAIFHKHPRLRDRDYTQGAYFVTLCTKPRRELFGRITGLGKNAMMELNDVGQIVDECWRGIPEHFPHAHLDQTQIMPDHLHAILILAPQIAPVPSTQWVDPTDAIGRARAHPNGPKRGSLGAIIGAFKSVTTKRINSATGNTGRTIWQYGYFERAIRRNGGEYGRISQYIAENPANWR